MRIKRFSYENKATGWKLEPMEFGEFNLLVGVSGVGKSKILRAILDLQKMVQGESLNGIVWEVQFSIGSSDYCWLGEFENTGFMQEIALPQTDQMNLPKIIYEELSCGSKVLVKRDIHQTLFNDVPLPKGLSSTKSIISLFKEDEKIAPIFAGFKGIVHHDQLDKLLADIFNIRFDNLRQEYQTLEAIQQSYVNPQLKLALIYFNTPEVFSEIKTYFIDLFPQVEDVKFDFSSQENLPFFIANFPLVYIKEVGQWITQSQVSSGMEKALMLIADFYTQAEGTIILIDELENSLGVNCINIFEHIPYRQHGLQFIITSHHPKIIGGIPMKNWKIVTRQGHIVTIHEAKEFKRLSALKLDPFIQLINLPEYVEGIE